MELQRPGWVREGLCVRFISKEADISKGCECVDHERNQFVDEASIHVNARPSNLAPWSMPTVQMSIRANHSTQEIGSACNLHVAKFLTRSCDPSQEDITLFGIVLNPEAFLVVESHAGKKRNMVASSRDGWHRQSG